MDSACFFCDRWVVLKLLYFVKVEEKKKKEKVAM